MSGATLRNQECVSMWKLSENQAKFSLVQNYNIPEENNESTLNIFLWCENTAAHTSNICQRFGGFLVMTETWCYVK